MSGASVSLSCSTSAHLGLLLLCFKLASSAMQAVSDRDGQGLAVTMHERDAMARARALRTVGTQEP
jgi:hypothetical protein